MIIYDKKASSGTVLFLSLIILVTLSLLAIFASSSGIMQERMTGNFRDDARSFEAAEAGLRWAEAWLGSIRNPLFRPTFCDPIAEAIDGGSIGESTCTPDNDPLTTEVVPKVSLLNNLFLEDSPDSFWTNETMPYGTDPFTGAVAEVMPDRLAITFPGVAQQPQIYIEHEYFDGDGSLSPSSQTGTDFFRITVRATGANPNNITILESTFAKRFQ